jgi:gamma-glutamyl AIG2-like cyclotransferase
MSDRAQQYVFAYGSLAGRPGRAARLAGYRRVWGVAMDNRVDVPGYKYYRRADGSRPDVYVAFLDIVPDPAALTRGSLIEADTSALRALDGRERNYDRIDVTAAVPDAPGRVWAYRGSAAGRERLRSGRVRASVVVDLRYVAGVRAAFEELGWQEEIDLEGLALMDLERIDLPPAT